MQTIYSFDSSGKVYAKLDNRDYQIQEHLSSVPEAHPRYGEGIRYETIFINSETFQRWHARGQENGKYVMMTTSQWTSQDAINNLGPLLAGNDASHCSGVETYPRSKVEIGWTLAGVIQIYVTDSRGFKVLQTISMQ